MNNTFNSWSNVDRFDLEKVVDLVLTNGTPKTILSDDWIIPMIGDINKSMSVLDFGCGVGRNIFNFSQKFPNWNFCGYDNDNMINKSLEYSRIRYNKSLNDYPNLDLVSDWNILKTKKFDCIYATIVFQHIYEKDINLYLKDIKQMTNRLIVTGRRFNDDMVDGKHKNTWQIFENNGLYPSNADIMNYKTDGDPEENMYCVYDI